MIYTVIGLALIALWGYIQYLNYRMNKIARKVEGKVVFANHGIDKNKKGQMIRDYYYTLVEFELDGVTLRKEIGEAFEEGEIVSGWYDEKRDLFITEKIKGIHQGKGTGVILFFGLVLVAFDPIMDILLNAGLFMKLPTVVSFLFAVCGGYLAYSERPKKLKVGLVKISARVADIKEEWVDKGYKYFPVYVYEDEDGDDVLYSSPLGRNPIRLKEGDQVELFLDPSDEKIYEKPEQSINYIFGLICMILGIVLVVISLFI